MEGRSLLQKINNQISRLVSRNIGAGTELNYYTI